ncbi:class I SAM-dependent methyltransferase [Streptomyces sp. L2]|uniref:class I SAM-dependent methyltransferase n=1 Tax=Streptomyces sp. L2 TaxID=2162665 RepID=UPI0013E8F84E|nr:class I SAM-dependent methyltransferase [Streptomyces sp. L2]
MRLEQMRADEKRIRASRAYDSERGPDIDQYHHLINAGYRAPEKGLWCEFGVSTGGSLWQLCGETSGPVYGFDSFAGLPEQWELSPKRSWPVGAFHGEPKALRDNARLVQGMFENTVSEFFVARGEPIALAHIDCDLYSSTRTVLDGIADYVVPGTVLIFDELYNYPNFMDHELRALLEVSEERSWTYAYIGHVPQRSAASLIITSTGEKE